VESKTKDSMHTINEVTNYPIIRPLIMMDKYDIVKLSKKINTFDISIKPYEDCCTIFVPKSPKTRPKRDKVNYLESKGEFTDLLEEAVNGIEVVKITDQTKTNDAFDHLF